MPLSFQNFTKEYNGKAVFQNFNFEAEDGKITCVIGGSGVGKTTLLNAAAGILSYSGTVKVPKGGQAYIFQNQALLRNLTVYGNIEYVLKGKIKEKEKRREMIDAVLQAVELYDNKKKYPSELSIGMAQRVTMARAFVTDAQFLLMDEPFRGLDIKIKDKLIRYFINLWEIKKPTVLFVTHSIEEAVLTADKIVVLAGSPVRIAADYNIDIPQNKRNLSDKEISAVYSAAYSAVIEN